MATRAKPLTVVGTALVLLGLVAIGLFRSSRSRSAVSAHTDAQGMGTIVSRTEHGRGAAASRPRAVSLPTLIVRVHDGNRPIRGAELTIRSEEGIRSKRTNAHGRAVVVLDRPGVLTVNAAAPGYVAKMTTVDVRERTARADLLLQASAAVRGRVIGYEGVPSRLSVVAVSEREEGKMATASIAGDGDFALTSLEPGTYAVGLHPSSFRTNEVLVHLEAGEEAEIELPMVEVGKLTVTAIFPEGTVPRPGELRLVRESDRSRLDRTVKLASGVSQDIEAVPAGRYAAELIVEGASRRPEQIVAVAVGQTTPVVFTWPGGELAGRVVNARGAVVGAGVAAFKVTVDQEGREIRSSHPDHSTETDEFGRYILRGLDPGRYAVGAMSIGMMGLGDAEVAEGEHRELDLRVAGVVSLETRVVYRGRPVVGAQVFATSLPVSLNARSAGTDASGIASVASLTPGSYRIHAVWNEGEDGPLREARAEVLVTGEEDQPLTLQLH